MTKFFTWLFITSFVIIVNGLFSEYVLRREIPMFIQGIGFIFLLVIDLVYCRYLMKVIMDIMDNK